MKAIINNLRHFISSHSVFHWTVLMVFCSISVALNYHFDLENSFFFYSPPIEFLCFVSLYSVHFFGAYFIYSIATKNFSFWKKYTFWILGFAGILVFAIRAVSTYHYSVIEYFTSGENIGVNIRIFNDVFRFLYIFLPICLIWFLFDKQQNLYGFSLKNHHTKIYLVLLLCMVPLIVGASFLSDFLDYYPRVSKLDSYNASFMQKVIFELIYGLDFVSIEMFFRGFLVLAFIKFVGPFSILPMASFYLSIHYGKPMGEAISSFFGGAILGVISFYSRSIYGGIMVHVGIAWLMELGAYIGNRIQDLGNKI